MAKTKRRIVSSHVASLLLASASILVTAPGAMAQEAPVEIANRVPPELRPVPITAAGLNFLPSLGVGVKYDNNIYGAGSDTKSDIIYTASPILTVRRESGGLTTVMALGADIERYQQYKAEDKENYQAGLSGSYDINSSWSIPFTIGYSNSYRDRGAAVGTEFRTTEPLRVKSRNAELGMVHKFNRLSVGLIGTYQAIALEDGTSAVDPTESVVYSHNNRAVIGARTEVKYDFMRGRSTADVAENYLFLNMGAERQNFEKRTYDGTGFNGVKRDRDQVGFLTGFHSSYKGILLADIGVGMKQQNFEESSLKTVTMKDFKASIKYMVTPKLTLGFMAGREIKQDNDLLQGIKESAYTFLPSYELLHNAFLNGQFSYTESEFVDTTRADKNYGAGVSLSYIHSPRFESIIGVKYAERDSNIDASDYDRTIFTVGIKSNF